MKSFDIYMDEFVKFTDRLAFSNLSLVLTIVIKK
jgi:hypothetical protein